MGFINGGKESVKAGTQYIKNVSEETLPMSQTNRERAISYNNGNH
jgi:hypothetical protein